MLFAIKSDLEKADHEYEYLIDEAKRDGIARLNIDPVIIRDGKILHIHRHSDNPNFPDCWCLPGGGVEDGEGVIESMIREVREELGVEIIKIVKLVTNPDGSPLYWDTHSPDYSKVWRMAYFVVEIKGEIKLMESDKHNRFEFTSKEDLHLYYSKEQLEPSSVKYRKELEVWDLAI
jgi:ADP-ribose pyrophosphatase YjhB (NUDIX family)